MRQKGFIILPLLVIVALAIALVYFMVQNNTLRRSLSEQPASSPTPSTPVQNTNLPTNTTAPTANPTDNWKSFKSPTLGIEFKISPKLEKYGLLSESVSPAEEGTYLCIIYPEKRSFFIKTVHAGGAACNILKFGMQANSIGFTAGRSGSYLDIQGFEYKNGKYYYNWLLGTDYERQEEIPSDIVTKYSDRIVKIKGKDYEEMAIWPSTGTVGAIINTGNTTYPALVISASLRDGLTESDFDQILSTFKFAM